jgi:hypothetical protein
MDLTTWGVMRDMVPDMHWQLVPFLRFMSTSSRFMSPLDKPTNLVLLLLT